MSESYNTDNGTYTSTHSCMYKHVFLHKHIHEHVHIHMDTYPTPSRNQPAKIMKHIENDDVDAILHMYVMCFGRVAALCDFGTELDRRPYVCT